MQNSNVNVSYGSNRLTIVVGIPRQLGNKDEATSLKEQSLAALSSALDTGMDAYRKVVTIAKQSDTGIGDLGCGKVSQGARTQSNKDNVVFYVPAPKFLHRDGYHGTAADEKIGEQLALLHRHVIVAVSEFWQHEINSKAKAKKRQAAEVTA